MLENTVVNYPITYCRLFALKNGDSDFSDEPLVFSAHPENKSASITAGFDSIYTKFLTSKAGAVFDWHPAPCRQFIFLLKGALEIEVSDGEKRIFRPGDFLFVEDTTGAGHITRVAGNSDAMIAVSPVNEG